MDAFTGGAGNDTLVATVATMGSLDTATGGDGADTISINESVDVASLPGTYTGFETLSLTTSGSIGATNVTAGSTTAAVANEIVLTPSSSGAFLTTSKLTITIGSAVYSNIAIGSAGVAGATAAIASALAAHLGDDAGDNDLVDIVDSGTAVTVTSKKAGTALPSISVSTTTSAGVAISADSIARTTTTNKSNVTATGPGAIKEVIQIAFSGTNGDGTPTTAKIDAGDVVTVSIDGVDYVGAITPGTDNSGYGSVANAASSVAALINAALGAGTAVASAGTVTVTAPTAGTPLPYISVSSAATSLVDVFTVAVQNQAANAAVTSASAVAAPTGVTTYNATASGVANVSAATTAKLVASGTTVQTSGGLDVNATGTKSVGVSGAKGAVVVGTSNASTGEVISNPGTGQTATYGSGIYVSGGTTVNVTQSGATITSGSAGTIRGNTIQVGVNPAAAKDAATSGTFTGAVKSPSGNAFYNAIGGLSGTPTGDVVVSTSTTYTTAAGKSAIAYGTGAASVYTNGGSTVSITGAGSSSNAITVTDVNTTFLASSATDTTGAAGTSKLATVNLTGIAGNATIKSDAISTVNLKDATGSKTVTISNSGTTGANSGAFNLNVGNSTVTVTNATATSVNVGSTAATTQQTLDGTAPVLNSSTLTLNSVKATSLNLTNANSLTLATGSAGLAKVTTITASGAGNLTADVSSATDYAKLVTVDASAKTGNVTLTVAPTSSFADSGQVIKTGSGADTVTLAGSIGSTTATAGGLVTTTVDLGAGNDALVKGSSGAIAAGAGVDGGAGTDTIDATLITIGNSALIKNFERLDLRGATDGGVFDSSVLANSTLDGVKLNGALSATSANTYGVTNLAGTTITADIVADTAAQVTTTLASSTGTADALNINFASVTTLSGTPAINTVTSVTATGLTSTGIETVNVSSGGTIVNPVNFFDTLVANKLKNYTDNSNKTTSIVVTGAREVTLGDIVVSRDSATKLTVDGATLTFNGDFINQNATYKAATVAGTSVAAADIQAALTTIDASATTGGANIWAGVSEGFTNGSTASGFSQIYDGLTIKGGSGSDMVRNSAKNGVTTGGDGKDWLIVDGTTGSADGGAGDDTLVANAAKGATLTGGSGNDTFDVTAATMAASGHDALTEASTLRPVTITDFASGDILKFGPTTLASGVLVNGTAAVAAATSLFSALDLALKATTSTTGITADVGTDVSVWFVYGGNTYIAHEANNSYNGLTGDDIVVKLTGIHTLSAAAVATPATGLFGEA